MPGPFTRTIGDWNNARARSQTWSTQGRPYIKPLPYLVLDYKTTYHREWPAGTAAGHQAVINNTLRPTVDVAVNAARAKFDGRLVDAAEMAVNLLERKRTISTIEKRATQLIRGARQIRKRDFKGAAKTFGISKPKGTSRKKQFSDNWLEYSFGWKPLVEDIGHAVEILQGPPPHRKVRAKGAHSVEYPSPGWYQGIHWPKRTSIGLVIGHAKVVCRGTIKGVNPDLFLANQMGFVNPLSIAWESVPFSFIVDWFTNVGDCLSSMTATVGVDLQDTSHTIQHTGTNHQFWHSWEFGSVGHIGAGFRMERKIGLPSLQPAMKPFKGFSVTRGITAISLLLQQLKS